MAGLLRGRGAWSAGLLSARNMSFHSNKKRARRMIPEEEVAKQVEAMQAKSKAMASSQVYMNSLGKVADDYIPGVTPGIGLRAKSELTNRLSEGKIKKDLPSFSARAFVEEAQTLYTRYQKAFAQGDVTEVRDMVSPSMMTRTKSLLAKRVFRPGETTLWEGRIAAAKVLTIRFIPVDELVLNFAQIAVRFQTAQKLRLVKKSGELIRETEERAIEDIWVFERVTNKRDETWKYCGTLPLPEGEESLLQMQAKHEAAKKKT